MKIDGGCHCGYITYEAEADPETTTICHCTDCQRLSGSAFRVVIRVPGDTFKITAGEPTIYVKTAESGARRVQGFCPRCGTPIYSTAEGDEPKFFSVRVGTLLQRAALVPQVQIWSRSQLGWLTDLASIFAGWKSSELRRLDRMRGISSEACRVASMHFS
jgi:hypothetical protein